MLVHGTPVERHRGIYVKREDLCCEAPGPPFSKMRGVIRHIRSRPEPVIGVLDTFHSKGGWAVAAACSRVGKQAVVYWPEYKADRDAGEAFKLRGSQANAETLLADLVKLPAGRSAVLYHGAKKHLQEHYGAVGAYMMPNALKLPEMVEETAAEVALTPELEFASTVVISISSGTIAAGVIRGLLDNEFNEAEEVVLHLGYTRSQKAVIQYLRDMTGEQELLTKIPLRLVDEGYQYRDAVDNSGIPFPCNSHYDAKAWNWLMREQDALPRPLLFWNIGD